MNKELEKRILAALAEAESSPYEAKPVRLMDRRSALAAVKAAMERDPGGPAGIHLASAAVPKGSRYGAPVTLLAVAWWGNQAYVEARRIFAPRGEVRHDRPRIIPRAVAAMLVSTDDAYRIAMKQYKELHRWLGDSLPKPQRGVAWQATEHSRSKDGYYKLQVRQWMWVSCRWYYAQPPVRWCAIDSIAVPCSWPQGEVWSSAHPELALVAELKRGGLSSSEARAAVLLSR